MEEWRRWRDSAYEVSNLGRVRKHGVEVRGSVSVSTGYQRTTTTHAAERRERTFHALVAECFIGPRPEGAHINHIDGDKLNNAISNLEYLTPAENIRHAAEHGLMSSGLRHGRATKPEATARGERVSTAVLTEAKVRRMRHLRSIGARIPDLAAQFGVGLRQVHNIISRKQWRHVA